MWEKFKINSFEDIKPGTVHVFKVPTTVDEIVLHRITRYISKEEQARAERFIDAHKQNQFRVIHAVVRILLSIYTKENSSSIVLRTTAGEAPEIIYPLLSPPIFMSLAHSGEFGAIALGCEVECGIDIEEIDPHLDFLSIARHAFTPGEVSGLENSADGKKQRELFYRIWTRKEAYMKARRSGMRFGLHKFEVSASFNPQQGLVWVEDDPNEGHQWQLIDFDIGETVLGSLFVRASQVSTRWYSLDLDDGYVIDMLP